MADAAAAEMEKKLAKLEEECTQERRKRVRTEGKLEEKEKHKQELAELRDKLEEKHERKMTELRDKLEEKRDKREEKHKQELAELRNKLEEKHKQELKEREETHKQELKEREETHKQELKEREETHERKMTEREEKHKEELAKWQSRIERQTNGIHRMSEAILQVGSDFVREFRELRGGATKAIEAQRLALDAAKRQPAATRSRMNDLLVSKSKQATMRLDGKTRGFTLLSKSSLDREEVVCVTGFEEDVNSEVETLATSDYKVESEFQVNANPDDFLDNVKQKGTEMVELRIQEHNDKLREKDANASDLIVSHKPPVSFDNPRQVTIELNQSAVSFSNRELASQDLDFENVITLEDVLGVYAHVQRITIAPPPHFEQILGDDKSEDLTAIIELAQPVEDIFYTQIQDIVDKARKLTIVDEAESS